MQGCGRHGGLFWKRWLDTCLRGQRELQDVNQAGLQRMPSIQLRNPFVSAVAVSGRPGGTVLYVEHFVPGCDSVAAGRLSCRLFRPTYLFMHACL